MKKIFFSLTLAAVLMQAQEISLHQIINYMRVHHPHYKALEEESIALEAKVNAEYARELSSFSVDAAQSDPDEGDSGMEYSGSLTIPLDLMGTRNLSLQSGMLQTEAELLKKQVALFAFGNRVRNLYHQSCLDKANVVLHEKSLASFEKLYRKKKIAYKYSEISKKELLQIEMERNLLVQQLNALKERYQTSKSALLNLTDMPDNTQQTLECKDLFPIKANIQIDNKPFLLSNLAYKKEQEALKKKYDRYTKFSDPMALSLNYDDELDTKRYGVGIEVPLGFTSQRNEQKRLYLSTQQGVLKYHHNAWLLEANAKRERTVADLKSNYHQIKALEENIQKYEKELMPLIEKSFQMGESSLIEYLLGHQKLLKMSVDLIHSKQNYYQNLFTLYTLIETEK